MTKCAFLALFGSPVKKMLESRTEDAQDLLVKSVETLEIVETVETVEM